MEQLLLKAVHLEINTYVFILYLAIKKRKDIDMKHLRSGQRNAQKPHGHSPAAANCAVSIMKHGYCI